MRKKGPEKRLADETIKKFPKLFAQVRSFLPDSALTKKPASRLDTRLIYEAANYIDKYRPKGKSWFPGRDVIIFRFFEAAFGHREPNQASIARALNRRKVAKGTAAHTATAAPAESC